MSRKPKTHNKKEKKFSEDKRKGMMKEKRKEREGRDER